MKFVLAVAAIAVGALLFWMDERDTKAAALLEREVAAVQAVCDSQKTCPEVPPDWPETHVTIEEFGFGYEAKPDQSGVRPSFHMQVHVMTDWRLNAYGGVGKRVRFDVTE